MTVKRWSLLRTVLPCVGLALTCVGVYLMSLQAEHMLEGPVWTLISAYITTALGLLSMVCGVFWTLFHSMKTKMYRRGSNREWQCMHIYSIERPTSSPPSYEESQQSQACAATCAEFVVVVDGAETAMGLAPPLYSQDSSEAPDCTWSWEQPPRYSQVQETQHGQVDAGGKTAVMSEARKVVA